MAEDALVRWEKRSLKAIENSKASLKMASSPVVGANNTCGSEDELCTVAHIQVTGVDDEL